ncbi:MAG: hypothetical protein ACREBI_01200 [Nitrosotalea sp.]
MNFPKLVNEIVEVDNAIRFVAIIDKEGKEIGSNVSTNEFFLKRESQQKTLGFDMLILKKIFDLYDDVLGTQNFAHLIRERVHVLLYYVKDLIIVVSCDRTISHHKIVGIAEGINQIIEKYIA